MNDLYGNYRTRKFTDIYPSADDFIEFYNELPTSLQVMSESSVTALYYLLYARYGNSHIANSDETQFAYKVASLMFTDGAIWEKKLEIQKAIRELDLTSDDILMGTKSIMNHSYNPSTEPSTATLEELTTIDDQNTNSYKYSKLEGLTRLYNFIENDITKQFIEKFKDLFLVIVEPYDPLWYISSEDDEEDDE